LRRSSGAEGALPSTAKLPSIVMAGLDPAIHAFLVSDIAVCSIVIPGRCGASNYGAQLRT